MSENHQEPMDNSNHVDSELSELHGRTNEDSNQDSKDRKGKKNYSIIKNEDRQKLIDLVMNKNKRVVDAARECGINASTAKGIITVYRKEGRVDKKCTRDRTTNIVYNFLVPNQAMMGGATALTPLFQAVNTVRGSDQNLHQLPANSGMQFMMNNCQMMPQTNSNMTQMHQQIPQIPQIQQIQSGMQGIQGLQGFPMRILPQCQHQQQQVEAQPVTQTNKANSGESQGDYSQIFREMTLRNLQMAMFNQMTSQIAQGVVLASMGAQVGAQISNQQSQIEAQMKAQLQAALQQNGGISMKEAVKPTSPQMVSPIVVPLSNRVENSVKPVEKAVKQEGN